MLAARLAVMAVAVEVVAVAAAVAIVTVAVALAVALAVRGEPLGPLAACVTLHGRFCAWEVLRADMEGSVRGGCRAESAAAHSKERSTAEMAGPPYSGAGAECTMSYP